MKRTAFQQADPIPATAGVGLRAPHYREILATRPRLGWFEAHSENYFGEGGQPLAMLDAIRTDYPVSLHGVGLSLGSCDPLDTNHLHKLKRLVERIDPCLVSEHLCWSSIDGRFFNELLPLPYSKESLQHLIERVTQMQDALGRQVLIENITAYVRFNDSTLDECAFLNELARASGCGLLLDVNNVYVNSVNHGFDARSFLDRIDAGHVQEIHLAGFDQAGEILVDTHSAPVCDAVWELYAQTIARIGPRPSLIEWDNDIPAFGILLEQARRAEDILERQNACAA